MSTQTPILAKPTMEPAINQSPVDLETIKLVLAATLLAAIACIASVFIATAICNIGGAVYSSQASW